MTNYHIGPHQTTWDHIGALDCVRHVALIAEDTRKGNFFSPSRQNSN